ncbi:MAG TPA: tetratricopeptide repeat protein [Thermodesulfovibrionales bacterium]|nr:tetratricopeptide repeat protein [Thermodesulfovibrionales bacterium]
MSISLRNGIVCAAVLLFLGVVFSFALGSHAYAQQDAADKSSSLLKESRKLFEEGSVDKAMEAARESVKADPNNADAYDQLGYMLLKKDRLDEAMGAFDAALKINPRVRTSKTGRGLVFFKKGDLKGAEETLKDALLLNPYPSMTHYALGLVYEKMNDYTKAVEEFKEGIKKYKSGKR